MLPSPPTTFQHSAEDALVLNSPGKPEYVTLRTYEGSAQMVRCSLTGSATGNRNPVIGALRPGMRLIGERCIICYLLLYFRFVICACCPYRIEVNLLPNLRAADIKIDICSTPATL